MVAISVKMDPIDRDIRLMISDLLSPDAQSAYLAEFARESAANIENANTQVLGEDVPPLVYVDGVLGANESAVRPDGTIVYEFNLIIDLLLFIGKSLEIRSPYLSGNYQRSHVLYADGEEVAIDNTIPTNAREYVFLNLEPYARKIEGVRYKGGGRKSGESSQAPDGVYELTAKEARDKFGNVATISYEYRSPASGAIVDYAKSSKRTSSKYKTGDERSRLDWLTNQPAIVVTVGTLH